MATIVSHVTIPNDELEGCVKCDEFPSVPNGYIVNTYLDDEGVYECVARCFTCNHRDRGIRRK